ncbi:hypothetical protein ABT56_18770 [Photobacterium aquae]|uniref:Conjugal transfer protein TraK n=1 Tax=Photobacterium aquae TaxID=1195763 RepID=A0A0J1GUT2_9GAMM|nr:type-F conjugative transfer system secretin TraK [Photobacterium aquae]KLV03483.1 hypothetical protein ABT56_18770 [Photobacterium aquae]
MNKKISKLTVAAFAILLIAPASGTKLASASFDSSSNEKAVYSKQIKQVVRGETVRAYISDRHINRIITPFKSPSVKGDSIKGVTINKIDNVLYVSTNQKQPIGMFITENGDELSAVKLLLVPEEMSSQEINLNGLPQIYSSVAAKQFEKSHPHIDLIKLVNKSLALGEVPKGYVQSSPNAYYFPTCYQEGLSFDFSRGQFFEGGDMVVSIGVISNKSPINIEFKENSCSYNNNGTINKNIVSVSAFPNVYLRPSQKTEVFVMQLKHEFREKSRQREKLVN